VFVTPTKLAGAGERHFFDSGPDGSGSGSSESGRGGGGSGSGVAELWVVRHGERVDETEAYAQWRAATPSHRRFDPELTATGQAQARDAGDFLVRAAAVEETPGGLSTSAAVAAAAEKFGCTIYVSPLARTLSTAHEIAQVLMVASGGKKKVDVRVVFGLSECAAAVRNEGTDDYRGQLGFLELEAMQALCPEVTGIEEEAPPKYADACTWLVEKTREKHSQQQQQQQVGTNGAAAEVATASVEVKPQHNSPPCCLVVTHREGIRDLMGLMMRLPYCAVARFEAESAGAAGPLLGCGTVIGDTQLRLLDLCDRDGTPLKVVSKNSRPAEQSTKPQSTSSFQKIRLYMMP
jgi:broad specificity phosphatase PhoE